MRDIKKTVRFTPILAAAFIFLSIAVTSWAGDYFVDAVNGNDTNTGSQSAPWKTLTKVNGFAFKAGDTVNFNSGGTWSGTLTPASGSSGAFVTYAAYGTGNKPVISNCNVSGKSYIMIKGLKFSSTTASYPLIITNGSSYVWVDGCEIYAESASTAYAAARIYMNSHHNRITNCTIEHRNLGIQNDALNLKFNANYNLIEGNKIGRATHYALTLEGSNATYPSYECKYNIIRNNTINNPEGAMVELQSNSNNNVVEGNIITGGKTSSFNANQPRSFKNVSNNNIIRMNVIHTNTQSAGSGLTSAAYQYNADPPNNVIGNHTYNNVITGIYTQPLVLDNYEPTVCQINRNVFKNNTLYNNGTANGYQLQITSYAGADNYFMNNLFYKSATTKVLNIRGATTDVAGIQNSDPVHFKGNTQQAPKFDSSFRPLVGSPTIDTGDYLSRIVSSTGTGTTFAVEDAGYFSDGFGIAAGDPIRVGSKTTTVTAVNRTQNTITVADTVTWTAGEPVSLPYSGSKPDIGAYEYEAGLPGPMNLRFSN